MTEKENCLSPIFIGGTGRSGTSIMADLLNSHPKIVLPAHENKLIVEAFGIRDLVDRFDGPSDHYCIDEALGVFKRRALSLRWSGFDNPILNKISIAVGLLMGRKGHHIHAPMRRLLSNASYTMHGIGNQFGQEHYETCVDQFVDGFYAQDNSVNGQIMTRYLKKHSREQAMEASRGFLANLYSPVTRKKGASRWCDDTPNNFLYLDFLHGLYPNMKFIHMVRDPRDVVSSTLGQAWSAGSVIAITHILKWHLAEYVSARDRLPEASLMEVRLEDLTENYQDTMKRVSDFLGLAENFDSSLFQMKQTNSGRHAFDLSRHDQEHVIEELGTWMRAQGYI